MENASDSKQFAILYVDDEESLSNALPRHSSLSFASLRLRTPRRGFASFRSTRTASALLMTDQRMPGEQGVRLAESPRALPSDLRILVTGYADMRPRLRGQSNAIYNTSPNPGRFLSWR